MEKWLLGIDSEQRKGYLGEVAVVTVAASGMGKATAAMLAAEGALVALCDIDDSQEEVAKATHRGSK